MSHSTKDSVPIYKRILLKLSGEALQGNSTSIDSKKLKQISEEIKNVLKLGVEVAIVIGGGNLIRGAEIAFCDRITADQMGMLATIINGLALKDSFERDSIPVHLMSATPMLGIADIYNRSQAKALLNDGRLVIFVGGTGNPLVTTDSAAALRGIEIQADILLKATKVDGVFAADPIKNPKAERYDQLTYDEIVDQRLGVMDLNAILLCRENSLPLRIFNMNKAGALKDIMMGTSVGTLVQSGE